LRYPVYAEADITVDSIEAPPEETVERVLKALEAWPGVTKTEG
jgi:shikimate kinase